MGVGYVSAAWAVLYGGGFALLSFLLRKTILKVSVMVSESVTVDLQAPTVLFPLGSFRLKSLSLFLPLSLSSLSIFSSQLVSGYLSVYMCVSFSLCLSLSPSLPSLSLQFLKLTNNSLFIVYERTCCGLY